MPVIMQNPVRENRCGRFSIAEIFLDDDPFLIMKVMSRCIIIEAVSKYRTKSIDYYAYSPDFESTEYASVPPKYDIVITKTEEGEKIQFVKTKDAYDGNTLRKITY